MFFRDVPWNSSLIWIKLDSEDLYVFTHLWVFFQEFQYVFQVPKRSVVTLFMFSGITPGGVQLFAWSPRWEDDLSSGEMEMTTRLWMPQNHESNKMIPSRKRSHIPQTWHFEDDFPFPKMGYVNSLEGIFFAHAIFVSPNLVSFFCKAGLTKHSFWDYQLHRWHYINWYITWAPPLISQAEDVGIEEAWQSLVETGEKRYTQLHHFSSKCTNRIETQMPWSTSLPKTHMFASKNLMIERLLSGATWVWGWFLIYFFNNFEP